MEKVILLTNASVVLVTENPPPSVTHDFLMNRKIIPENFQIQKNTFYTPPISQINYNNGFCIVTEPNKISFQIQMSKPTVNIEEQKECLEILHKVALQYVQFFSDIKHQAMGINFQMIRDDDLKFEVFVKRTVKSDSPFLSMSLVSVK